MKMMTISHINNITSNNTTKSTDTSSQVPLSPQEYNNICTRTTFELHSLLFKPPPNSHPITSLFDLDPSKYLEFFVPPSEQLTSALILQHQKSDFVLAIVRLWLKNRNKPLKKTANITGNKGA